MLVAYGPSRSRLHPFPNRISKGEGSTTDVTGTTVELVAALPPASVIRARHLGRERRPGTEERPEKDNEQQQVRCATDETRYDTFLAGLRFLGNESAGSSRRTSNYSIFGALRAAAARGSALIRRFTLACSCPPAQRARPRRGYRLRDKLDQRFGNLGTGERAS